MNRSLTVNGGQVESQHRLKMESHHRLQQSHQEILTVNGDAGFKDITWTTWVAN